MVMGADCDIPPVFFSPCKFFISCGVWVSFK